MKAEKFITEIFQGNFSIPTTIIDNYLSWCDFEKNLDQFGCRETTTFYGWQYSFNSQQNSPTWLEQCNVNLHDIKKEVGLSRTKSLWTILYQPGGYQDPHFHQPENNLYTVILNLFGDGELLLFDPRPLATAHGASIVEKVNLSAGDWIALPSWLVHSTSPTTGLRGVLVADIYK